MNVKNSSSMPDIFISLSVKSMPINRILCGTYKNIVTGSVFHLGTNTDSTVQELEQKEKVQ
jgi:hypothetical protein